MVVLILHVGVDILSEATCVVGDAGLDIAVKGAPYHVLVAFLTRHPATECVSEHGKAMCKDINGDCITTRDGYYLISGLCMILGLILVVGFIIPRALKLQGQSVIHCIAIVLIFINSPSNICMAC
jgi:PAT family acetyl-CoA transporter-like MFS transporter 1